MKRRTVGFSSPVIGALRTIAARRAPRETGGLLLGTAGLRRPARVTGYVELRNVDQRVDRYAAEPGLVRRWLRTTPAGGADVVGYFHSHPRGPATPSELDDATMGSGRFHLLIGARGELRAYARSRPDDPLEEATVAEISSGGALVLPRSE